MLKLQTPSKYSPLDAIHLSRCLFLLLKTVFQFIHFMTFSACAIFCFTSSTLAKCFPFLIQKNNKKSSWQDWVNREGGTQGSCPFWQKLLNTQYRVGRYVPKSPIMKWANILEESSKKIHRSGTQPLTTTPAGTPIQMGF